MAELLDYHVASCIHILLYGRYIDDLFIIWTGTDAQPPEFQTYCNGLIPGIKLTWSGLSNTVGFLDITVYYSDFYNSINTCVFQKALNQFQYITPSSSHPPHVFTGFIKGELTRYARLSTEKHTYDSIKGQFYTRLRDRGYPGSLIGSTFNNHNWKDRNLAIGLAKKALMMPFVLPYTYRDDQKQLRKLIYSYGSIIEANYLPGTHSQVVYSAGRNIGSLISTSALTIHQLSALENQK